MLKYLLIILFFSGGVALAQQKDAERKSNYAVTEKVDDALNNYISTRASFKRSDTKLFSKMEQNTLDDICYDMQKKYPSAWQTDLAMYLNDHFNGTNGDRIQKAYEKAPNDKRVVKALFGYYILTGDYGKQKDLASKVKGYYSANTLSYYEDVLPIKGVLIVSSEEEALPLRALQLTKGKSKDVEIVNMDYLINEQYRASVAASLGTGSMAFAHNEASFVKTAMSTPGVHLSTTVPKAYLTKVSSDTYITGLYFEKRIGDQEHKLESFWKTIAKKNFASMSLSGSEKRLYSNYLPPLLTLYKIRMMYGQKDPTLRKAITVLADKVGQTKAIKNILMQYENG